MTTDFADSAKYASNVADYGVAAWGQGLNMKTGTQGSIIIFWNPFFASSVTSTPKLFDGSPLVSFSVCIDAVGNSNGIEAAFVVGPLTATSDAFNWTNNHFGFALKRSGGSLDLFATQADGSTENRSSALSSGLVAGDALDLIMRKNADSSVDYYFRKNGSALSAATNLTSNIPLAATASDSVRVGAATDEGSAELSVNVSQASYIR
jgi:hypothetical protein